MVLYLILYIASLAHARGKYQEVLRRMFEEEYTKYNGRLHFHIDRNEQVTAEETVEGIDTTPPGFALVISIAGQHNEAKGESDGETTDIEIDVDAHDDIEIGTKYE